jgi:chemotaxis protein methyltransferase CheR
LDFKSSEAKKIIDYIYSVTGIVIDSIYDYLIDISLSPLLEEFKVTTIYNLVLKAKSSSLISQKIIDAISTNETYFFRDKHPFELLKNKLIPLVLEKSSKVAIWSAAASTGQEAYSMAISADEESRAPVKIFGTDICSEAVAKAQKGVYTSFEVKRGLTEEQVDKYFSKISNREFMISPKIKNMVQFRRGNLLKDPIFSGMYDIVFCRNVAIYFSNDDKRLLLERLHRSLKPSGILVIGSTESIAYGADLFAREMSSSGVFYKKIG